MKHGILCKEVIVQGLCIKESNRQLQAMRRQFWQHHAPVGAHEEMLVDQIVTCYWRKRRVLKAESGEIALSVGEGVWERLKDKAGQRMRFEQARCVHGESKLKLSTAGVDYMMEVLETARGLVEENGELTQEQFEDVVKVFGYEPNGVSFALAVLDDWRKTNPEGLEPAMVKEKYQQVVCCYIDDQLKKFRRNRLILEMREKMEDESRRAASVLPSVETLDKILRYETTLERQLYRAMHELERLQRMRKGENVPPPLTMEVSH
ncbi:MAG: hypothetical protein NT105_11495 [Verrucomicrobia bacterium]|nr:hypothetical protein [Verrucomicrobiota bacterium]